jgi:hypothetical protein
MSCQITFNDNGSIRKVNTPTGEESQLFNQISKLPHVGSLENALEIYKNKYKDGVSDEAPLNFISDKGASFPTFREALLDSDAGEITVKSSEMELMKVSANTNMQTTEGLVNNLIKDNILSEEQIVDQGEVFYKAAGFDILKQLSNEITLKPLKANIKIHKDGRIEIKDAVKIKKSLAGSLLKDALDNTTNIKKSILSEEVLRERMFDFLKNIGVTVTTIENYKKNYKTRNGVDVSAQALADFSNQVVAFREGKVETDVLTEEVAHFIIEGWNEQEIENLLRNAHKTESYQEHAEKYREIYQREYPNQDVENLVRREVLGKELAKALQSKFNTEGKTEVQVNILSKLYDLLVGFFNRIVLQDNYKEQLDNLTDRVEDMLLSKDVSNYINSEQYVDKKFRLYSTSTVGNPHQALVRALQEQEKILIKLNRGSSNQMQQLQGYLATEMEKSTVRELINLANRQTRYTIEAIGEANKRSKTLSNEEAMVFQNLKNIISPALSLLKVSIQKDDTYKSELIDIEDTLQNISDAVGLIQQNDNRIVDSIVDRLIRIANRDVKLDEDGNFIEDDTLKKELTAMIKTSKKDTGGIFQYFGQISNAQDPLLNALSSVISDITTDTSHIFEKEAKTFQKKLRELGFKEEGLKKITQDDGYIISEWNFAEHREYERYSRAQAYRDNLPAIIKDLEDRGKSGEELDVHKSFLGLGEEAFLAKFKELPQISNPNNFQKVKTEAQKLLNLGGETFLKDEYIKEQEDRLKGLSEETKIILGNLSEMRGQVRRSKKKSKSGIPIYSLQNKIDLDAIASRRATYLSPYTFEGTFKPGLAITQTAINGQGFKSVKISDTDYLVLNEAKATKDCAVTFELNEYNRRFIDKIQEDAKKTGKGFNEGLTDTWNKELKDMEADPEMTREDIVSWFNLNTSVGFSNEFFSKKTESQIEKFKDDPEIEGRIAQQKSILTERKNLLNRYKDSKNSLNTMTSSMPSGVQKRIKELTIELEQVSQVIFNHISKQDKFVREENLSLAETRPNESYYNQLEDLNKTTVGEKLEFTLEHMTPQNKQSVNEYKEAVSGGTKSKRTLDLIKKYGDSVDGVLEYAQTRMLPYYASYAPTALQDFYSEVRNTNKPLSELVDKLTQSKDVRLSVSYEYLDQSNDEMLNPARRKDFKGGVSQPSLTKTPTLFGKTFSFKNENWSKVQSDPKLKAMHDLYVDFKYKAQEYMDYKEGNVYEIPQVPETTLQRLEAISKGQGKERFKEIIDEIKNYRVGDLTEGEMDEAGNSLVSSNIKVIPRYFTRKLERKDNVSKDIFYSTMMMMEQGILRSNRVKYYNEVSAIMDAIGDDTRYTGIGKQASATNTYKMAQSFRDNAIFGIEDVKRARMNFPIIGEVDVTKTIKVIHRWKQNLSLALNPAVAATSFLTAKAGLVGERWVGQYIDSDSYSKGSRLFYKNGFKGKADVLEVYSKQESSAIMEHLGLMKVGDRFKDSQYSKVARLAGDSFHKLSQMADYPIKGEIAYAMMVGHKIFNGRVVNFNDYNRILAQAGKTKIEIKNSWGSLSSLYDYVEVKDGIFSYSDNLRTQVDNIEEAEKIVITRARQMAQRVDGTIRDEERTYAQRNYLLRYTMTHRGWEVIALANRFKGRHYNTQTGIYEEGNYRTAGRLVTDTLNSLFGKNPKNLKEIWMNMSQEDKVNMQRIYKEMAILGAIYAFGLIFAGFASDDEDDYSKQALAYLFERTTNETTSSQLGLVKELYSTIKEPFVGSKQVLDMLSVHKLLTGDEIIKSGRFHGLSERERYILQSVVGTKPVYDLMNAKNLKSQRDTYNHFASETNSWNPFSWIITKKEYLEDNEEE